MKNRLWTGVRGHGAGTRIVVAALAIVFAVAAAAPGLAQDAASEEPTATPEPVVGEPAASGADELTDFEQQPEGSGSSALVAAANTEPLSSAGMVGITSSPSVTPEFISGNPALGDGGVKIEDPASGTYHYDDVDEVNQPGVPLDFELIITVDGDGKTFSFSSNYPITEVVVKGGPDANAYRYPDGTYGDSGLVSPTKENGVVPGLSHINFYFGQIEEPETGDLVIHKYEDANENGEYDEGEKMLPGWEFSVVNPAGPIVPKEINATVALIGSGSTGSDGTLAFSDLAPGTVLVTETLQDGWKSTTGLSQEAQIVAGETTHLWFGNVYDPDTPETGDLAVYKYEDANENGEYDEGEKMLKDWEFTVPDVGDGLTDEYGELLFPGLAPGEYTVTETMQDGWHSTTGGLKQLATVVAGETTELWFGNAPDPIVPETGDLVIHKYEDANENGEYDEGEKMLEDWVFTLTLESEPIGPVVPSMSAIELVGLGSTDSDGELLFSELEPGEYAATETLQEGWRSTTGLKQFVTVSAGQTAELWFGNVYDPEAPETGDLAVYKYEDANENGEYDEGEEMLEDWEFTVTLESPPISDDVDASAVMYVGDGLTDEYGELLFPGLAPGEYTVTETMQDGWHSTTGGLKQLATVVAGETTELWFGNAPDPIVPETGDLVIHKYEDANENGEYDEGEKMLPGWEFSVVNPAGPIVPQEINATVALIGSGSTGSDGTLAFSDLAPGTVLVTETLQDGWKSTTGLSQEAQIVVGETTHLWFGNAEEFLPFTELDLAITKVADDHTVSEGQLVTYTLTYWNLMSEEDAIDFTIVDDYDERYLTIVNSGGGTVAGGKITWKLAGPLSQAMGKQTITYTARVLADMPDSTVNIDNKVVIDDDRDFNLVNNQDDERVVYRPEDDPYLPFTGGDYTTLLVIAAFAIVCGFALRMGSRVRS